VGAGKDINGGNLEDDAPICRSPGPKLCRKPSNQNLAFVPDPPLRRLREVVDATGLLWAWDELEFSSGGSRPWVFGSRRAFAFSLSGSRKA
jgi:hypothetical protein